MSPTEKLRFSNMEHFGYGPNVMKKTKVCPNCGKMLEVTIGTCPECGESLSNETLFDRYKKQHPCCPDCDTVLASDSKYCPNCGRPIDLSSLTRQSYVGHIGTQFCMAE